MALAVLLFAHHGAEEGGEPYCVLRPGGISLLERQLRQAGLHGASRALIYAERMPPGLAQTVEILRREGMPIDLVRSASGLAEHLGSSAERWLVFDEGLLADDRLVAAFFTKAREQTAPSLLAIWDQGSPFATHAERLDSRSFFAGIALHEAARIRAVAATLGEWDMQGTLLRSAAADPQTLRIDLGDTDAYAPAVRAVVPLLWRRVTTAADVAEAGDALRVTVQAGEGDAPYRWIYAPLTVRLTRLCMKADLPTSGLFFANVLMTLAAAAAFATGWRWLGILLLLLLGSVDRIAPTLADLRMERQSWQRHVRVMCRISEYLVYLGLAASFDAAWAWALAAIILVMRHVERLEMRFYETMTGQSLDEAGRFEWWFRQFAAHRNIFAWGLLPFALFGFWAAGLVMIAFHAGASFLVTQWRSHKRLAARTGM